MNVKSFMTDASAVRVPIGDIVLQGDLVRPANPYGLIVFAHGSGSSRHSPRNQFVAHALHQRGFATLLIDLLTMDEEAADRRTAHLRFDIGLLATRLVAIRAWLTGRHDTADLSVGLFGASTGGGAALVAAAERPGEIAAVVSRGGRPDLAGDALPRVMAPTLLIVGSNDRTVVELNRKAMSSMRGTVVLEIVPGATHLFEEPGTLDRVAVLAGDWFVRHLTTVSRTS
jgi:putative phosphoribosyl transferase